MKTPICLTLAFIAASTLLLGNYNPTPNHEETSYSKEQVSQLNKLMDAEEPKPVAPPPPEKPDARRFARAESNGNSNARNRHSSASGLLQFTNGTWKSSVSKWGKPLHIRLKDKNNPKAQLALGQKLAEDNARIIARKTGKQPTEAELYAAHVLGAHDAVKLLDAAAKTPNRKASTLYSKSLVNANRGIFYAGNKPRTVIQVCELLKEKLA